MSTDSPSSKAKNIVLITVDSLRADYISGPKAPESLETLSILRDRGIDCTNAFSNAAYTKGSFLSIMSGTYPWMFDSTQDGYGPDRPHIAAMLSDAGYATAGFHTNTYLSPTYNYDRGFDYYLGRDSTADDTLKTDSATVYNKLVERAVATQGVSNIVHWVYKFAGKRLGVQLGSNLYKPARELNDEIVEWTRQNSEPVFVWAHYMDVHNPYYPHDGTVSEDVSPRKAIKLFHRVNELRADAPKRDIETLETLYRGEIEQFDRQLGDLFARLDETLDLEETIIGFASDHGEAFDENGQVFHPGSALYDPNVHVPLVFQCPDVGEAEIPTPVSNVDIVPTLLSQAGLDIPPSVVGDDVTRFVEQNQNDRKVFVEAWDSTNGHVMVTDGEKKLVRHLETDEEELYDRRESPEKRCDPADHPQRYGELCDALDEHLTAVRGTQGRSGDVAVSEDVRLQLRKLGYDE